MLHQMQQQIENCLSKKYLKELSGFPVVARKSHMPGRVFFLSLAVFHSQYGKHCIELIYKRILVDFIVFGAAFADIFIFRI